MNARLEAQLRPGTDYHPLQVIPFFRRWKPSQLRSIVLTAILCGVIIALIWPVILTDNGPFLVLFPSIGRKKLT